LLKNLGIIAYNIAYNKNIRSQIMLFAIAFLSMSFGAPSPVVYELKLSKSQFVVGEPIKAELIVKNVSKNPVVIAKAIWDGAPAGYADGRLFRNGKPVDYFAETSMPLVQVVHSNKVDKNRFIILKSQEQYVLYSATYLGEYDFRGSKTRLKEDYARATKISLKKGKYQCEISYDFSQEELAKQGKNQWNKIIEFEPGAKKLWDSAIKASVKLTKSFEIKEILDMKENRV
jgi:hypothetical protein